MLGYAFCGSFCTHAQSIEQMRRLLEMGYEIQPIMSEAVWQTDTRFGSAVGLLLTAYLAALGSYELMAPLALEAFLLLWTLPVILIGDLAGRY